jgi:DNA-binding MarR family transcriptional regulator
VKRNIGYLLKTINDKLAVYGNAAMAEFGLTFTQSRVLAILHAAGGEMAQKELECALEVSHATVAGLVSRMQEHGFLETRQDETDRRSKIITLTAKAHAVGEELDKTTDEHNRKMLTGLTKEQTASLYDMLTVIDKNITR